MLVIDKTPKSKPAQANKHDFGHDKFIGGLFKHCWCMCPKCWQSYKTIGSGKANIGRCVCPSCPCNNIL